MLQRYVGVFLDKCGKDDYGIQGNLLNVAECF